MTEWIIGKIQEVKHWNQFLFSIKLSADIDPFIAGQFTKLSLKINGERIQRAYSYVNSPKDKILEFYLTNVPDGKLSQHLKLLNPGDQIMISKQSSGFFILNTVPNCQILWMLATGTAIGPYLSILTNGEDLDKFEKIVLVYAVRYSADLNYLSLIKELQNKYKNKLYVQTIVSREKCLNNSLYGRIPFLIQNNILEKRLGLEINSKNSHIMLCGNPQMVHDTQHILLATRNMHKNLKNKPGHVTTENYW